MTAQMWTPGPWRWEINPNSKQAELCGGNPNAGFGKFDETVMDFVRWGMGGAAPRFRNDRSPRIMERPDAMMALVPGREHHAHWFQTLSHPDANLIAAAPDLATALKEAISHLEHMAAWIGAQAAGYSFESLGEDMPGFREALAKAQGQS